MIRKSSKNVQTRQNFSKLVAKPEINRAVAGHSDLKYCKNI